MMQASGRAKKLDRLGRRGLWREIEVEGVGDTGVKTFLLGVGCQKGGTTWLFDYLSNSPSVRLGLLKEYHVFDLLDLEIGQQKLKRLTKKGRVQTRKEIGNAEEVKLKLYLLDDIENYFKYFTSLLSEPGVLLTADITPAYAALSPARFAFIKDGFEERGVDVKVVFLMRDPVERVWSSVRMMLRDRAERRPSAPVLQRRGDDLVAERHDSKNHQARTNYHSTIDNLEQVFDPANIFYGFYETFFREKTLRDLCGFLGIPYVEPALDQRQNESPRTEGISEGVSREIATSYAEVYSFIKGRFGDDFINGIWPSARLL